MYKIVQIENIEFVVCECKEFGRAWTVATLLKDSFGDLAIMKGDEIRWTVRDGVTKRGLTI